MKLSLIKFFVLVAFCCSTRIISYGQDISDLDTITNTIVSPFNNVVYQSIGRKKTFGRADYKSTGFLIARNIILTAGHNIHSNMFTKVDNIKFYIGRYKEEYPYDSIEISGKMLRKKLIYVHPSYKFADKNRIRYDFGIIIIPDSIISKYPKWPKSISFELNTHYQLEINDKIHVAGYPASNGYDGSLMTYQNQRVSRIHDKSFEHEFDTETGNSGSPIWIEVNGKRIIVGVHTFAGVATKLTKDYVDLIFDWIKTHK